MAAVIGNLAYERADRDGMRGSAVLSPDGRYRYLLTRTWEGDLPAAVWIMLNPSTADHAADDATIRRVVGFSRRWGCGKAVVVNLFALRSRHPTALKTALADPAGDPVGPANDRVITAVLESAAADGPVGPVVAAWGAHGALLRRDVQVLQLVTGAGLSARCLAVTAGGMPWHPLFVRADAALRPYPPAVAGKDAHGR